MANRRLMKGFCVFVVSALVLALCLFLAASDSAERTKSRYNYIASDAANLTISNINYALDRAFTVEALVEDNDGSTDFFNDIVPSIYQNIVAETGVRLKNIAIAPGGVVEKVYPMSGNEGLIGFNFMDASEPGNAEAIEAYNSGQIVVTEPFELTQGGTGMGCRVPVFMGSGNSRTFWGIITLTIDYDSLVNNLDFSTLDQLGANYELWYTDNDGVKHVVKASENEPADAVTHDFSIRNVTWHLSVSQDGGWVGPAWLLLGGLLILVVSFLLALLVYQRESLHESNEELNRFAMLDSLAGCYRRQYINHALLRPGTNEWSNPLTRYSLLMVDLDYFKGVNDTYGHTLGDEVIVRTAKVLQDNIRASSGDCVIRYGGDEFVVLFNDVTRERYREKVQSIVQGIYSIRIPSSSDLRLTSSIGGVYYDDAESYEFYKMLETADKRLYEAKNAGRDRVVIE